MKPVKDILFERIEKELQGHPERVLLRDLARRLIYHDWTYAYSDDHAVWLRGQAARSRINSLCRKVKDRAKGWEIWEECCPDHVLFYNPFGKVSPDAVPDGTESEADPD